MSPKKQPPAAVKDEEPEVRKGARPKKPKQAFSPPSHEPTKRQPKPPAAADKKDDATGPRGVSPTALAAVFKAGSAPPATIQMETGLPEAPLDWRAKDAARLAATGATNQARLAGTVTIRLRTTKGELEALVAEKRVVPVNRVIGGKKGSAQQQPQLRAVVTWEEATGEFSTPQGQLPLSRLREALLRRRAELVEPAADGKLLEHLWALQCPISSPWKRPLCRLRSAYISSSAAAATSASPKAKKAKGKAKSKAKAKEEQDASVDVELTFYVYFGRLIFELIADADIQGVMSRLKPCGPVTPTTPLPPTTPMFKKSPLPASATKAPTVIEIGSDDDDEDDEVVVVCDDSVMIIDDSPAAASAASSGGEKEKGKKRKASPSKKGKGKGKGKGAAVKREDGAVVASAGGLSDAEAYEFEVGGLLRAAESEGYAIRDPQPPGLRVSLFEFQHSTLQWMLDRERDPRGLNMHFWEAWAWADSKDASDAFFYFPAAGELRIHKPPLRTGGLLCEEMGMGKTVELLALILANPRDPATLLASASSASTASSGSSSGKVTFGGKDNEPVVGGATLIVTPSTLLGQYITEIDKCTNMGAVPTAVYVGNLRVNFWAKQLRLLGADGLVGKRCTRQELEVGTKVLAPVCVFDEEEEDVQGAVGSGQAGLSEAEKEERRVRLRAQYFEGVVQKIGPHGDTVVVQYAYSPEALAGESIVLTTYETLRSHGQMLKKVAWHRIVVDECQELRVGTSQVARMAASLQATHRWMVSGTPIAASVDDVHGELQFLGIHPFGLQQDGFWETIIGGPFRQHRSRKALDLLHILIGACMMRHSKGQTYLDGRPLLSLPARTIAWVPVAVTSPAEKFVYAYLEILAAKECARLVEQALTAAAAQGGGAAKIKKAQVLALQQIEAAGGARGGRGRGWAGGGAANAGAHGKLKALLFMMQRALCHPKQLSLQQLDTIKRSLQIQQRLGMLGGAGLGGGGAEGDIPLLRIDDMLSRLQGRNAQGGLVRDVNRTWAMAGDQMERERDKLEALPLQELRARVEKEGLPVPIAWLQLPVRCAILRGTDSLEVALHNEQDASKASPSSTNPSSPPPPAFPAAILPLGGPGSPSSPSVATALASAAAAATAKSAAAATANAQDGHAAASSNGKGAGKKPGGKRLDGLLAPKDIVRVGANDEDNERVVTAMAVTDPSGAGQKGVATVEPLWTGENQRKALLFKKAPATRKKAYADLLLARERELKGAASEIHEAGFASIFALLEGHDQTCSICLCTIQDPTVTACAHVFCKVEVAKAHSGVPTTRCGICRKPVPLGSLMQLDVSAIEKFDEAEHASSSASAAAASSAAASAAEEDGDDDDDDDEDEYSGGSSYYGKGKGKGKARAKGKGPAKKKSKPSSSSAAAGAAAMELGDDGGGKMSPEELEAATNGHNGLHHHHASSASASSAAAAATTSGSAISLPPVAFAPTADEETLQALPPPTRPVPRDNRLPSLDPAFLGHVYAMMQVLSAKMAAILGDMRATLAADPGAKFVVFSQFVDSLDTLGSALADQGFACVAISSHTAKAERQRAVSSFSTNPKVQVILVTMGTGAAGLTLTAASTVYLLEPTHSPADEAQALNRAHRIGQQRPVRCLILFCQGTVEERMLAARRREDSFMSQLENESAALTSVGAQGGKDAEKKAHFSLAAFQTLLGMDQL